MLARRLYGASLGRLAQARLRREFPCCLKAAATVAIFNNDARTRSHHQLALYKLLKGLYDGSLRIPLLPHNHLRLL